MNISKAVKILEKQLGRLNSESDKNWILQTKSYVKDFLGEESLEYKSIRYFEFTRPSSNFKEDANKRWRKDSEDEIKANILAIIEVIKSKGLKKEPFLNSISKTAFWAIVGILIPGLILIGFFFGELKSDKQNIDLRLELIKTKDSLLFFNTISPKPNTRPEPKRESKEPKQTKK